MNAKLREQRGGKVRLRHRDLTANHIRIVEMGAIHTISMVNGSFQDSERTDLHSNKLKHVLLYETLLAHLKAIFRPAR